MFIFVIKFYSKNFLLKMIYKEKSKKYLTIVQMKPYLFFILLAIFSFSYCNEMTSEQVKSLTGKQVYSRSKTIELFQIASIQLLGRCQQEPLNYMINKGYANFFTKSFYLQKNVDSCLLLFFTIDCPSSTDTSTSIKYYKNFLNNCNIKSYP